MHAVKITELEIKFSKTGVCIFIVVYLIDSIFRHDFGFDLACFIGCAVELKQAIEHDDVYFTLLLWHFFHLEVEGPSILTVNVNVVILCMILKGLS